MKTFVLSGDQFSKSDLNRCSLLCLWLENQRGSRFHTWAQIWFPQGSFFCLELSKRCFTFLSKFRLFFLSQNVFCCVFFRTTGKNSLMGLFYQSKYVEKRKGKTFFVSFFSQIITIIFPCVKPGGKINYSAQKIYRETFIML